MMVEIAMIRSVIILSLFIFAGSSLIVTVDAHDGATGIVKQRMDRFSESKQQLKQIQAALGAQDFKTIATAATSIRDWARVMPDYFPEGSGEAPSKALPRIWESFDSFVNEAKAHEIAADALILAAQSEQQDETINAFKQLAQTCSSCHKAFRQ
ncbi:cytochrome c [Alphaproteobacteria bacterium]|nr:cytochrome c [Alphaproteobacteria bacterium]